MSSASSVGKNLNTSMRWAIIAALSVLLLSMAIGQSGITNYMELQKNKEDLIATNISLSIENQRLEDKIKNLKSSKEAQKHYLKNKLGFISNNEYIYHFPNNGIGKTKAKQASLPKSSSL